MWRCHCPISVYLRLLWIARRFYLLICETKSWIYKRIECLPYMNKLTFIFSWENKITFWTTREIRQHRSHFKILKKFHWNITVKYDSIVKTLQWSWNVCLRHDVCNILITLLNNTAIIFFWNIANNFWNEQKWFYH